MLKVFISFTSTSEKDNELAQYLSKELVKKDFFVWNFKNLLRPGDEFKNEIYDQINKSSFFLPIISKESLERAYVRREIYAAFLKQFQLRGKIKRFIVPVLNDSKDNLTKSFLIKNGIDKEIKAMIFEIENELEYVDFFKKEQKEALESLMTTLNGILKPADLQFESFHWEKGESENTILAIKDAMKNPSSPALASYLIERENFFNVSADIRLLSNNNRLCVAIGLFRVGDIPNDELFRLELSTNKTENKMVIYYLERGGVICSTDYDNRPEIKTNTLYHFEIKYFNYSIEYSINGEEGVLPCPKCRDTTRNVYFKQGDINKIKLMVWSHETFEVEISNIKFNNQNIKLFSCLK